jgi:Tol biopolymer transport system component
MSRDRFDVLDRFEPLFQVPEPSFERFVRLRDRKRRNQRMAAGGVAIAVFATAVWIVTTGGPFDGTRTPARPGGESKRVESPEEPGPPGRVQGTPPASGVPEVDYVIDLNTDVMTPLPQSIIRTAGETAGADWPSGLRTPRACSGGDCGDAQYVVSPDGSLLAFVGTGEEGTPQIFIAGIDGTGVRQMTHEPIGATSPAWSPDGTMIAYASNGQETATVTGLFVLDVATGESTRVTDGFIYDVDGLQFTPDGSSLIYTHVAPTADCFDPGCGYIQSVPIAGGASTVLIGPGTDAWDILSSAENGSLSPDGSLVTFNGVRPGSDVASWVANDDGTGLRELPGCYDGIPAGTWSPDGSRIACNESLPPTYAVILVVDVATGDARRVAIGVSATWLDDHTLLVEV